MFRVCSLLPQYERTEQATARLFLYLQHGKPSWSRVTKHSITYESLGKILPTFQMCWPTDYLILISTLCLQAQKRCNTKSSEDWKA